MPKALAHFGRALEFGNVGRSYSVAIRVYVDRAEVEAIKASRRSYDTATRKVDKPFLFHATNDIGDEMSKKAFNDLVEKLESELAKAVLSRKGPTVRLEIYESGEMNEKAKPFDGYRGEDSGVYIELCPWGTEFTPDEEEEIKDAIKRIVPNEMVGVKAGDIRSIDAVRVREIKLLIHIVNREFAEGVDGLIWKRCVSGVLNRYIEGHCGLRALVRISKGQDMNALKRKRTPAGSELDPIRIQGLFADDGMTDEQADGLRDKLDDELSACLPGIRRILSRIYMMGTEDEDKIEVEWGSATGNEVDDTWGPERSGGR